LVDWAAGTWAIFDSHWAIRSITRGALVQVGMFFVMSGFILTYSHPLGPKGEFHTRSYVLARFARVYAMYILGLLATLPVFIFFVGEQLKRIDQPTAAFAPVDPAVEPTSPQTLPAEPTPPTESVDGTARKSRPPEPTYTKNELVLAGITIPLLLHAWIPKLTIFPWNPPAWSLSVEAFAYVVFPFVLLLIWRWSTRRLIVFAAVCWVLSTIPPLWYVVVDPDKMGGVDWNMNVPYFNFVRHFPLFRLPEFLIGMVIGRIYSEQAAANARDGKGTGAWMSCGAFIAVILCLMFSEEIVGPTASYMLLHNGILAPIFALGVAGLALGGGPLAALCSWRWVVTLGESAYAIYLLHFPFLAYSVAVFIDGTKKNPPQAPPEPWTYLVVFLVGTTMLSVFVHTRMERNLRRQIRDLVAWLWPDRTVKPTN
jgi:peptidoglycan/LPS O-acetylase OafA/YrhL